MKIDSVRYGRTKNTGNYESERFDVEVALDDGDTFADALDLCRGLAAAALDEMTNEQTDALLTQMNKAGVK